MIKLYLNDSYVELDPFVLILSKIKESKTMIRSVRAGLPRESMKSHFASTDSNQPAGMLVKISFEISKNQIENN